MNLIETYRTAMLSCIDESCIKLHRDFHHLNSSQAACLNLFWPLLNCSRPELTVAALDIGPQEIQSWAFEKVIDSREKTNFDLYLEMNSGAETIIEFKYTEEYFGKVKNDPNHRQKLCEIYYPTLRDIITPKYLEASKFFNNYQLLRNLTHMKPARGDTVVFVIPRANAKLKAGIGKVLNEAVLCHAARSSIKIRFIEDIVYFALDCLSEYDGRLYKHFQEYHKKYVAFESL